MSGRDPGAAWTWATVEALEEDLDEFGMSGWPTHWPNRERHDLDRADTSTASG